MPQIVPATRPTGPFGRAASTALLVMLVAFTVFVIVRILPLAHDEWLRRTFG
ncbi:hypothetical protein [Micromonospora arborensis]|uniref:hypothetical protein n=1 Tax=Micromonospora arborensis TaxID=2116518 RepID=UPI003718CA16